MTVFKIVTSRKCLSNDQGKFDHVDRREFIFIFRTFMGLLVDGIAGKSTILWFIGTSPSTRSTKFNYDYI